MSMLYAVVSILLFQKLKKKCKINFFYPIIQQQFSIISHKNGALSRDAIILLTKIYSYLVGLEVLFGLYQQVLTYSGQRTMKD